MDSSEYGSIGVTTGSNSQSFLGTFGNQTVDLSLTNITTPHNAIQMSFDLYTLNSWDGSVMNPSLFSEFQGAPDFFNLQLAGVTLLHTTFTNNSGSTNGNLETQSYPNNFGYALNPAFTGSAAHNTLGYGISQANSPGQTFRTLPTTLRSL